MEYLMNTVLMRENDTAAIRETGIPELVLIERAAYAAAEEIRKQWPDERRILILCGSGNNGADGFAAARILKEGGCDVTILFAGKESAMTESCRLERSICEKLGLVPVDDCDFADYPILVDALIGIGLTREVTGRYKTLIERMNASPARRAALDLPSGIHADNGSILGTAVHADLTITFAARKIGHILYPGSEYCGKVICRQVGIPMRYGGSTFTYGKEDMKKLPRRTPDSNKTTYGKILIAAGSEGMSGAAFLCALAAFRTGCGMVRIFTPECNRTVIQSLLPEAIVTTYRTKEDAVSKLRSLFEWADVIGVGPGIGTGLISEMILEEIIRNSALPLVIDADGLNLLAKREDLLSCLGNRLIPAVLTPHPGEMKRLLHTEQIPLPDERIDLCRDFASKFSLICAAKDARTIVSDGTKVYLNESGNSGMAAAGSGDVLTGVICGLLGQNCEPFEAASLGVFLHGLAGDEAASEIGSPGMLARDIADSAAAVLKRNEEEQENAMYRRA